MRAQYIMKYSFKSLWNRAFLFVGPGWYFLVWMIWSSGQLQSIGDRITFLVSEPFLPKVKNAFILEDITGSDHCPVGIELNW